MKKIIVLASLTIALSASAQTIEPVKYGDMESWVTRIIKESGIIGGEERKIYVLGPNKTIKENKAYDFTATDSPWSSSNSYAKVSGVEKGSVTVTPEKREDGGTCARLEMKLEKVKALGIINVQVVAGGSLFTGTTIEPIKSTDDPNQNINFGIPFTRRPKALIFDYKCEVSPENTMTSTLGGGKPKEITGHDCAAAKMVLQYRWEDSNGNIHALRVATAMERYDKSVPQWQNAHRIPLTYGDITNQAWYKPWMGLSSEERALNSKGKIVPIQEEGWDATKTPTHAIIVFASGCQGAFVGHVGNIMWVDNVKLEY